MQITYSYAKLTCPFFAQLRVTVRDPCTLGTHFAITLSGLFHPRAVSIAFSFASMSGYWTPGSLPVFACRRRIRQICAVTIASRVTGGAGLAAVDADDTVPGDAGDSGSARETFMRCVLG